MYHLKPVKFIVAVAVICAMTAGCKTDTTKQDHISKMVKENGGFKPIAIVVSAPSGCGKDTAVNAMVASNKDLIKVVSVTTRPMRPGEKEGFDYHFVTPEQFDKLSREGKLVQESVAYGAKRGILMSDVENAIKTRKNLVFNVSTKGYRDLKKVLGSSIDVVGLFILPPSKQELRNRLVKRGTETEEAINYRMSKIDEAMDGFGSYEFMVVGDTPKEALKEINEIYAAVKLNYQKGFAHARKLIESGDVPVYSGCTLPRIENLTAPGQVKNCVCRTKPN